jgi:tRNA(fMet)-specific endonuclease VapC
VAGRLILLDTGVLIKVERGQLDMRQVIGDDDPAIAGVTASEILVGVESSPAQYRDIRALHIESMLTVLPIEPHNKVVARMHAVLLNWTRQNGRPRGPFDLIIAATAGATGRVLLTTDQSARFDELPGVKAEVISPN